MGTTGLETAFAAVYTELVRARACCRWRWSSRSCRRAPRCSACRRRGSRSARPADLVPDRPRRRSGRSARPATRAARRTAASPGARCAARVLATVAAGARRLPGAGVRPERRVSAYVLLEDGDALRRRRRRRARPGDRRGRLHDRHVGLPGVDDRPELRAPADHVHRPARRQLRRQRGGDGVRPHPRARGDHARRGQLRPTRPAPSRAGSTGCATTASRASTASTRARSSATSATRARCAAAIFPGDDARGRGARARSPPSRAWSAATSRAR